MIDKDPASYLVSLVVSIALVAIYFHPPAEVRKRGFGKEGFGVAKQPAPKGLIPTTLGEQLRSGQVSSWTQTEYMFHQFPDLELYVDEGQLQALLDPNVPKEGKNFILENARRRKERPPVTKDMFGRVQR